LTAQTLLQFDTLRAEFAEGPGQHQPG